MKPDEVTTKLLESAKNLEKKNIQNILKRAASGKPLTIAQQKTVDQFRDKANDRPATDDPKYGSLPQWGKNKVEAAQLLDVPNRNAFSTWRRIYDDAPRNRSNHQENLWEWFDFLEKHPDIRENFKAASTEEKSKSDARLSTARANYMEHRVRVATNKVLNADDMLRAYAHSILEVKAKLGNVGNALALKLSMTASQSDCKDMVDEAIRDAMNEFTNGEFTGFACPNCKEEIAA